MRRRIPALLLLLLRRLVLLFVVLLVVLIPPPLLLARVSLRWLVLAAAWDPPVRAPRLKVWWYFRSGGLEVA
jgi:hypothetical protein